MGKMPFGSEDPGIGSWIGQKSGSEVQHLLIREGMEEAFEKYDGFAEASIKVVVGGIEEVPFAFGEEARGVVQFGNGGGKRLIEIFDEFEESCDFVKKLRAPGEEDAAADAIQASGSATLGMLKIVGVEQAEIGSDAEVPGVRVHGAKYDQ
jgi:hypothetical protein